MRLFLLLAGSMISGQDFTQRGYLELRGFAFPRDAPNDKANLVGEARFRYEFEQNLGGGLRLNGSTETQIDTHHQVERRFYVNYRDLDLQRPAFSIRRASVLYNKRRWTLEAGKQTIRWGKADILNPTDRFAPRDFLFVVNNDVLAVTAGRAIYEGQRNSLELVLQPRFTPSRAPLLDQRWAVVPDALRGADLKDLGSRIPGGSQFGARWNHLGDHFEASISVYNGRNHLPSLTGSFDFSSNAVQFERWYPKLRLYGIDAVLPLPWVTIKGEAAYFTTTSPETDEYVIYVVQAERQVGELSLVAGYAGEHVTESRNSFQFAPDRGIAKSFLGRASYTVDPTRVVALEYVLRQNGDGLWLRSEYSQSFGQHVRATAGFTAIRGNPEDFLGQFRLNSHFSLALRYSF